MLTIQEHLSLAEKNEQFADIISSLPQRFPNWEITVLFYSALHFASALLASEGHYPENHRQRNALVAELTTFGQDYQNLYRLSLNSLYRMAAFTSARVEAVRQGPFRRVKDNVLSLLGNLS